MARPTDPGSPLQLLARTAFGAAAFAIALGVTIAFHGRAIGQGPIPVLVRVGDRGRIDTRKRVVRYDVSRRREQEIYRSDGHILGEVALSSDGSYASIVEVVQAPAGPELRLVVLDLSGHVVRIVPQGGDRGVREYAWCCDQSKIAVITGVLGEPPTFMPESASVIDVRTGAERQLQGIWRPQQIYWAGFDTSLYIKGAPPPSARGVAGAQWPVYRYQFQSGRLSASTHRGVFFSPDGKYYFDPVPSDFRLYRTADDRDVTETLRLPPEQIRWGPEGGWMPGADHVLIFIEEPVAPIHKPGQPRERARPLDTDAPRALPTSWNLAVDAETGRVIDRFEGGLTGWKTNVPALPLERGTRVEFYQPRRP